MIRLEGILRHDRAVIAGGLALVLAFAWAYLWQGAGMGMSALDMTALSLFPHKQTAMTGSMDASLPLLVLMWWVMMIAMMTPSAAPLMLLYSAVLRHHGRSPGTACGSTAQLLAGYLLVWLAFSIAAALLQKVLQPAGLISGMMWWSRSAMLSALVLAAAGLYQLSPMKSACLRQCRSPARFLADRWRPGLLAGFSMGVRHGAFCVGCCWMMMTLLFVGGVMNLVWIAALTLLVLAEKLLPGGRVVAMVSGVTMIAWALATLVA